MKMGLSGSTVRTCATVLHIADPESVLPRFCPFDNQNRVYPWVNERNKHLLLLVISFFFLLWAPKRIANEMFICSHILSDWLDEDEVLTGRKSVLVFPVPSFVMYKRITSRVMNIRLRNDPSYAATFPNFTESWKRECLGVFRFSSNFFPFSKTLHCASLLDPCPLGCYCYIYFGLVLRASDVISLFL